MRISDWSSDVCSSDLAIPAADVRDLIGGGAKTMLTRALEITGGAVSDARFEELHGSLLAFYEDNIAVESRLFSGGEAMLDGLAARGVKLAVVTNKLERFAVQIFDQLGISAIRRASSRERRCQSV